jgi:hypothetical protein
MSHETIEELKERRDLLKEIVELSAKMPSEDDMEALAEHVRNLVTLTNLNADTRMPSEDEMEALANHITNLKVLADATA